MKLSYLELLSPEPVRFPQVGSIRAPKLRDIAVLGHDTYQKYLALLLLEPRSFLALDGREETYDQMPEEERIRLTVFDLLLATQENRQLVEDALNFFLSEPVAYVPEHHCFVTGEDGRTGIITASSYPQVCDLICQRNRVRSNREDLSRVTSKKARRILAKLQKGRARKARQSAPDNNLELGNVISAVANRSSSLHMVNIWDLTVYQLWDCFYRLSNNQIYEIQAMSVAAWGDKNHTFNAASWYQNVEKL